MRRYKSLLLMMGVALFLTTRASAVNLVLMPKLLRHKTTGDLLLVITLANKEDKKVEAIRLEEAELEIKGQFSRPDTPLPFIVGDIEGKKEEEFSVRFDRKAGKKGETGMLRLKAVTEKEFVTGLFRVTIP